MTRSVRFAMVFAAALTLGTSLAQAQTSAAPEGKYSAEITAAATLGHTSASSFGGELDYRFADKWEKWTATFEFGRMRNIANADLQARANLIAAGLEGSANATQKATYYDFGARYRLTPRGMWHPYVAAGIGAATVTTETSFNAGNDVTVSPGVDLQGTVTKPLLVIGGGVTVPFLSRYFADGSYRYGRIFSRTGVIENDNGINTQRLQIGVGIRF
jgi:opacity protein-like surface antigen